MDASKEINPRSLGAWHEGRQAFIDSLPPRGLLAAHRADALCPYPVILRTYNYRRWAWWCGWYYTQVEFRLAHIFERNGLEW